MTSQKEKGADVLKGKPLIGAFTENGYWWMWIPIIGRLPFFFPLILPLGPLGLLGSRAPMISFLRESYIHNGENVASNIAGSVTGTYTLGYETVIRAYRVLKRMRKRCGFEQEKGRIQWNPLWLLIYSVCPALVLMPLVRAMCRHWELHVEQGTFTLIATGDGKGFGVQFEPPVIKVISEDEKVTSVQISDIPQQRPSGSGDSDFYIQQDNKKIGIHLRGNHRNIFWKVIES